MLTALYCITMIQAKSINYFKGEHVQTQFWSNFENTKCCDNLEYRVNLVYSFLSVNNVSMQVWCRKFHLFRRQSSEKADLQFFF